LDETPSYTVVSIFHIPVCYYVWYIWYDAANGAALLYRAYIISEQEYKTFSRLEICRTQWVDFAADCKPNPFQSQTKLLNREFLSAR